MWRYRAEESAAWAFERFGDQDWGTDTKFTHGQKKSQLLRLGEQLRDARQQTPGRAAIQHAADALWPASEEAHRPIRKTFSIPPNRAMGL